MGSCDDEHDDTPFLGCDSVQPTKLVVNVYPMDGVLLDLGKLTREVNCDYFNHHGISVQFILRKGQNLPERFRNDSTLFIVPRITDSFSELNLFVIPNRFMRWNLIGYAYPVLGNMMVRESAIYSNAVPHEIGHLLNLNHVKDFNNTMYRAGLVPSNRAPKIFVHQQIDTMIQRMNLNFDNRSSKTNNVIIIN